jgi:hypothetical protein
MALVHAASPSLVPVAPSARAVPPMPPLDLGRAVSLDSVPSATESTLSHVSITTDSGASSALRQIGARIRAVGDALAFVPPGGLPSDDAATAAERRAAARTWGFVVEWLRCLAEWGLLDGRGVARWAAHVAATMGASAAGASGDAPAALALLCATGAVAVAVAAVGVEAMGGAGEDAALARVLRAAQRACNAVEADAEGEGTGASTPAVRAPADARGVARALWVRLLERQRGSLGVGSA